MRKIHYVATLVVKRVELEDGTNRAGQLATKPSPRKVGDVAALTLRSGDLELLKTKVKDHLLLVEDDPNIELDEERVTRG